MQWTDNDYYLTHLPDGRNSKYGSIFLDYRNDSGFNDQNTLIFGHRMSSGAMFGNLGKYKDQSFYDRNPTVEIYLQDIDYQLVLIAGYQLEASEEITIRFGSSDSFFRYIDDIKNRSLFYSNVEVNENDRLVSLYTCDYDFKNARLV